MIEFTERHHAFLSACWYRLLRDRAPAGWEAVFRAAVRRYAEERGGRMAQRALRDGQPLDFAAYRAYSEWRGTARSRAELGTRTETAAEGGDLVQRVYGCPWCAQYQAMGLEEGGIAYCADLDVSIARGFNPALRYELAQTQYGGRGFCLHRQCGAQPAREVPPPPDGVRDFEYHCAHLYFTFLRLTTAVWGAAGAQDGAQVLAAFAAEYGGGAADRLLRWRDESFIYIR